MTTGRTSLALRTAAFLVQLVALALLAAFLFLMSKPPDNPSGMPGVVQGPPAPPWLFPYSIALGLSGIAAIKYRTAAIAAGLLTTVALGYGISISAGKPPEMLGLSFGTVLAGTAGLSIVGLALRLFGDRRAISRT